MDVKSWLQFGALFVSILGLIWAIVSNIKQSKRVLEQMKLNFITDYTKRYQQIIINLPEEISDDDFDFSSFSKEIQDKTMRYIRAYFDLCSEEYDLYKNGYIDERTWNNWQSGMECAFNKNAFKTAWAKIKVDTIFYEDFKSWLESEIIHNI